MMIAASPSTVPPTPAPAPAAAAVAAAVRPPAPNACKTATVLPAATAPPLATAALDIMPAAMEPAAIPAEVKPMAPRTTGAPTTPATAPPPTAAHVKSPMSCCSVYSAEKYTPQGVRGQPDGAANNKDTRLASPPVEKRCAYSPTQERGRTPQHRQEKRDRNQEQTSENKENIAAQEKDVEIFALPPPRTPVSSKKNPRYNKNVLTTPNQNVKTKPVTPKGGGGSASKEHKKRAVEFKELANVEILPFSPERRSRSLDMAVTEDSGEKKKRGGKVFGSLERGLDKMITMLTPSKRRALRDGPHKIKAQYNVTLTSQTNPDQVLNQILSILPEKKVDFTQKGYTLKCRTWGDFGKVTMAFELEVCLLHRPEVVGIRRQRLKGDAWVYKHLVEEILSSSKI